MNDSIRDGVPRSVPFLFESIKPEPKTWSVELDTSLEEPDCRTASVPFFLYLQPEAKIAVDWGDGTSSLLEHTAYTNSSSLASVHEYDHPGRWTVRMLSENWERVWMSSCSGMVISGGRYNDKTACLKWWRKSLVSCGRLPKMGGLLHFHQCSPNIVVSGLFNGSDCLDSAFEECRHLESVADDLLEEWKDCRSCRRMFWGCASLKSVPRRVLASICRDADFHFCFYGCPAGEGNA